MAGEERDRMMRPLVPLPRSSRSAAPFQAWPSSPAAQHMSQGIRARRLKAQVGAVLIQQPGITLWAGHVAGRNTMRLQHLQHAAEASCSPYLGRGAVLAAQCLQAAAASPAPEGPAVGGQLHLPPTTPEAFWAQLSLSLPGRTEARPARCLPGPAPHALQRCRQAWNRGWLAAAQRRPGLMLATVPGSPRLGEPGEQRRQGLGRLRPSWPLSCGRPVHRVQQWAQQCLLLCGSQAQGHPEP